MTPMQAHAQRLSALAAQVARRAAAGQKVHITRDAEHHVVPLPGDPRFRNIPINISDLSHIVDIDENEQTCTCEPGVSFERLVRATLPRGLVPVVVPELRGITVGGAVAGCSVESMSYRYGGFHDNCFEYEMIDGRGEVIRCSPTTEPELFHMLHGSYGTLGILSLVRFRLLPARPFVKLTYRTLERFSDFQAEMHRLCLSHEYELIDGIIHSPREHVLCLGQFVEQAPYLSDYKTQDIYYKSTRTRTEDFLETEDYFFRYDTECHWLSRQVPPLEWPIVRRWLGRYLLGSTNLIRWSNRLAPLFALKRRPEVVCDVFIPLANFEAFFRWYERDFDFYPLWVVPYRVPGPYPWVAPEFGRKLFEACTDNLIIDCAVYGKANNHPDLDYSVLLENKTHELYGIKTLISRNHYTEEAFFQVYNREAIRAAKARTDPQGLFPDLYQTYGRVE